MATLANIKLWWTVPKQPDSFRIYHDLSPFAIDALPAEPIATIAASDRNYLHRDCDTQVDHFYRIASVKNDRLYVSRGVRVKAKKSFVISCANALDIASVYSALMLEPSTNDAIVQQNFEISFNDQKYAIAGVNLSQAILTNLEDVISALGLSVWGDSSDITYFNLNNVGNLRIKITSKLTTQSTTSYQANSSLGIASNNENTTVVFLNPDGIYGSGQFESGNENIPAEMMNEPSIYFCLEKEELPEIYPTDAMVLKSAATLEPISIGSLKGLVTIDWGDGSVSESVSGNISHTYQSPDRHTITIKKVSDDLGFNGLGTLVISGLYNIEEVVQWHPYGYEMLNMADTNVGQPHNPTLLKVPSVMPNVSSGNGLSNLFWNCTNFNDPSVINWDVSNTTLFHGTFYGCTNFNQDISKWSMKNAVLLDNFLNNAESFNQDLSKWCVTNITTEPSGFSYGSSLTQEHKPVWGTCPNG